MRLTVIHVFLLVVSERGGDLRRYLRVTERDLYQDLKSLAALGFRVSAASILSTSLSGIKVNMGVSEN